MIAAHYTYSRRFVIKEDAGSTAPGRETVDVIGWLWWVVSSAVGLVWSLLWFLIGGWVSAFAQILVVGLVIFGMKYGWQRAPFELWAKAKSFGSFVWGWVRARDSATGAGSVEVREVVRTVRVKEPGDVNLSSLLTAATLLGLLAIAKI